MAKLTVNENEITLISERDQDYISLTDMANAKDGSSRAADIIKNWIRARYTLEFVGTWELINNPDFKVVEFDHFKSQAGLPSFVLSISEWIESTNAIGFIVKKGKYGGTYAHKDIAFEFGSAISVPFKLYLIQEFQRLKENEQAKIGWTVKRELSKINYHIHTDAIKENLIPIKIVDTHLSVIYASEADILNVAIFGKTAKEWKEEALENLGNIRDEATIEQLVVLSNLESINSLLIQQNLPQNERIIQLNKVAISQMIFLVRNRNVQYLK